MRTLYHFLLNLMIESVDDAILLFLASFLEPLGEEPHTDLPRSLGLLSGQLFCNAIKENLYFIFNLNHYL